MTAVKVWLPPKLHWVFQGDARYRGAYGGRGSGKTRSFATMLAVRGALYAQAGTSGVLLCAREFMNSLDDSSFAEVKAAIQSTPWLDARYECGEKFIRTKCRRVSFVFSGLRHNLDSIKSKARILIAWVDEAEKVSEGAWRKLIPTVREAGSEVWVTWNPEDDGSPTDLRFRKTPPDDARIVELNYGDNPKFPAVLEQERLADLRIRPNDYAHIWEGAYKTNSEARVFSNWRVEEFETPAGTRFYFGADWGFSKDPTTLVRIWLDGRTMYIDYEAHKVGCEIDRTPALFDTVPESRKWQITADSARPETISYMQRNGFPKMIGALKGKDSVEDGVEFMKSYEIVIHPRCKNTIVEFGKYSYKVDEKTLEVLPILADKDNHVIDAARYALEGVRRARMSQSQELRI